MKSTPITAAMPSSPAPAPMIAALGSSSDWMQTYFHVLGDYHQKARAAQAAGQTLQAIVRRRHTDPAFAEDEAIRLEAFADLLESEAIRRVLPPRDTDPTPRKKPFGSDSLLIRLLNLFHPKFASFRSVERSLSRSSHQANALRRASRPPTPNEDGTFKSRADLVAFREWERHQSIALALDLLADLENPPVVPPASVPSRGQRSSPHTPCADTIFDSSDDAPSIKAPAPRVPSTESIESAPIESPADSLSPTQAWSLVESAIARFRAEIKHLKRQGYSKNSEAIATLTAQIAECEAMKAALFHHLASDENPVSAHPRPPP